MLQKESLYLKKKSESYMSYIYNKYRIIIIVVLTFKLRKSAFMENIQKIKILISEIA